MSQLCFVDNDREKVTKRRDEEKPSLMDFFKLELTRGYLLEHDEERYTARREKMYTFMRIPREVERFMYHGVLQCADSFLYIHTFLPIRYLLALWALITRPISRLFGFSRRNKILTSAEICDLLKGSIWICCCVAMLFVDTNRMYHVIKSQSFIKLYIFYNMLEVGDRLLSSFGQDTIDTLFWTATESKKTRKEHLGLISHIIFALIYMALHSVLIMLQSTALNVAVNSNNKGLMMIMMSNNFVELKGSVFKKFDKNNLFQLSCSDVRERFHLAILLLIVVIQTMKEFSWKQDQLLEMLPPCAFVLITELFIDWIKHAFITRFNELPVDVYKEYTLSLAYDMTQTRQKHAFSDHSDLVARRMGFIPFPLAVVLFKAVYHAITIDNMAAVIIFFLGYLALVTLRIINTIYALGKACDLMEQHALQINTSTPHKAGQQFSAAATSSGVRPMSTTDTATSPVHAFPLQQRSKTNDAIPEVKIRTSLISSPPEKMTASIIDDSANLGATAIFSNSDVDLDDVCLNEKILNISSGTTSATTTCNLTSNGGFEADLTRSVPDLQKNPEADILTGGGGGGGGGSDDDDSAEVSSRRTHRRSESEPFIQNIQSIQS